MFTTSIQFHSSLIFVGKTRILPLTWCPIRGFTEVDSSLAFKNKTRVEVANTPAYYDTTAITAVKSFIVLAPAVC